MSLGRVSSRPRIYSQTTKWIAAALLLLTTASGQTQTTQPDALRLTNSLIALQSRIKGAAATSKATLVMQIRRVAQQRLIVLNHEMISNPRAVLRTALANSLRGQMPPEIQPLLEQKVEVQGTLEVGYEEYARGAILRYYLHGPSGRLELHFAEHPPNHLLTGARIKVKGVQ